MFHYNEPFPNPGMKTGVAKRRLMFQSAMWLNKKAVNYTSYSLDYHKADKHQLDKRKGGDTNLCCCFFLYCFGFFLSRKWHYFTTAGHSICKDRFPLPVTDKTVSCSSAALVPADYTCGSSTLSTCKSCCL